MAGQSGSNIRAVKPTVITIKHHEVQLTYSIKINQLLKRDKKQNTIGSEIIRFIKKVLFREKGTKRKQVLNH